VYPLLLRNDRPGLSWRGSSSLSIFTFDLLEEKLSTVAPTPQDVNRQQGSHPLLLSSFAMLRFWCTVWLDINTWIKVAILSSVNWVGQKRVDAIVLVDLWSVSDSLHRLPAFASQFGSVQANLVKQSNLRPESPWDLLRSSDRVRYQCRFSIVPSPMVPRWAIAKSTSQRLQYSMLLGHESSSQTPFLLLLVWVLVCKRQNEGDYLLAAHFLTYKRPKAGLP